MFQGGSEHLHGLRTPSGAEQQFGEAQRSGGRCRIGFQGFPVAGFGVRAAPQEFEHEGAVGQRPGARRTRGAVQHLIEERERPRRIAAHRECGRGGGPNPGRDSLAARLQHAFEERRCRPRVASPQPCLGQPAGRAERRSLQGFAGPGHEGSENLGGSAGVPGKQLYPRPANCERRFPRIPGRGGLRHARRLRHLTAVEQQSQQLHPIVPAPVADRGEQQVAAAGPKPALLVAREQPPPLGGQIGIRILGQQLPEPEANGRIGG